MGIFLSSKLPKQTLAHVWCVKQAFLIDHVQMSLRNLVDVNHTGKLNAEQFALAMHLISKKVGDIVCLVGVHLQ